MAKAKSKQVYMSPALTGLESTMKENGGSFSARLGEIVERYQMILDLEELPEFSEDEMEILNEVLSRKVEKMGAGQRLALIEKMGQ